MLSNRSNIHAVDEKRRALVWQLFICVLCLSAGVFLGFPIAYRQGQRSIVRKIPAAVLVNMPDLPVMSSHDSARDTQYIKEQTNIQTLKLAEKTVAVLDSVYHISNSPETTAVVTETPSVQKKTEGLQEIIERKADSVEKLKDTVKKLSSQLLILRMKGLSMIYGRPSFPDSLDDIYLQNIYVDVRDSVYNVRPRSLFRPDLQRNYVLFSTNNDMIRFVHNNDTLPTFLSSSTDRPYGLTGQLGMQYDFRSKDFVPGVGVRYDYGRYSGGVWLNYNTHERYVFPEIRGRYDIFHISKKNKSK